jgi:hypothetical protein
VSGAEPRAKMAGSETTREGTSMHHAKAYGYELTCRRDGDAAVMTLRHSPLSPAGLRAAFVLGLFLVMALLITGAAIAYAQDGDAVRTAVVAVAGLAIVAGAVPKQLMLVFGSQSVHAQGEKLTVRQDCVVWSRVEVLELSAAYVVPADRGWFRRHWEESAWPRPGVVGGLSVRAANGVEVARFGVGLSRRAAERLCGNGRIELFESG